MAAETAGLVMGAVGLTALFDNAVPCFENIRLGVDFERNFTTCQLRLEDTRARLCRWGKAVGVHDKEAATRLLGLDNAREAEKRLRQIRVCFDEAEKTCQEYVQGNPEAELIGPNPDMDLRPPAANLRRAFRSLYSLSSGTSGVLRRASWSLHGEQNFRKLIDDMNNLITGLEWLVPQLDAKLRTLCKVEISEIDNQESIAILMEATTTREGNTTYHLDQVLKTVVENCLGHTFENTKNGDDAKVQMGNLVSSGAVASTDFGGRHVFKDTSNSDRTRVLMGNSVEKKGFWDD